MEKPTEEDIKQLEQIKQVEAASLKQQATNIQNEAAEKAQQAAADAQAAIDAANQKIAEIPTKIEDELDNFNKTLKSLMGKNISPKVDINSPEFDINVAIGDLNKILDPVLGAISPVETVVGKIPVLGDLAGAIMKITSGGSTGGLSKEDIKKLVPKPPEIPPTLKAKVQETLITIQEFCQQLPMLLIKVIFAMLGAIFDMFDQIVGIIGVPPAIFPFNLVKQMPTIVEKIQDFATNAPSQIKTIVEGKMKDQFAAAQALATPQLPKPDQALNAAKNSASDAATAAAGGAAPKPKEPDPLPSPVTPSPSTPPISTPVKSELTWDEVKAKWVKRFHDDYNYKEEDIAKVVDHYREIYDGSNTQLDEWIFIDGIFDDYYKFFRVIRRKPYTPNNCDNSLNSMYKNKKVYDRKLVDKTILRGKTLTGYNDIPGDKIVIGVPIEPESSFLGLF